MRIKSHIIELIEHTVQMKSSYIYIYIYIMGTLEKLYLKLTMTKEL